MNKAVSVLTPFLCFMIVYLAFQYVFLIGHVPTDSMEPAVKEGSYILGCRIYEKPVAGDIIIFERNGELHVKRIAATEYEEVIQEGKRVQVPKGCCYVLGDNRERSIDSRAWEDPFVSEKQIKGVLIYPKNDL